MINSSNGINSLKEFIKEKDKFYDEEIESIINNIYINVEKQIDIISIEEFNNITLNSIYKIVINLKKIIILKTRLENSSLNYEEEVKCLMKLSKSKLIPHQYFFMKIRGIYVSAENYVDGFHIKECDTLNRNYLYLLMECLCKFHVTEIKEIKTNECYKMNNFYPNHIAEITTTCGEEAFYRNLDCFINTADSNLRQYYCDNKEKIEKIKIFIEEKFTHQNRIKYFYPNNTKHLIFSHNDVHNQNFFIENTENNSIKFIDFEDLQFNFPGFDLANYINESNFQFTNIYPYYKYNRDLMYLSNHNLLDLFCKYLNNLKNEQNTIMCNDFTLSEIYKLFLISSLKAIYEYLKMYDINDSAADKKEKVDFLLLSYDMIQHFYYLLQKLNDKLRNP